MKVKISQDYYLLEGKSYIAVRFFGRSDEEILNGAEDLAYNFAFSLPDIMPNNPNIPVVKTILDNLEIGINQIFEMYKKDIEVKR